MRLTEHTETSYRLKDCPKDCIRICNGCDLLKRAIRRLGELEDIEHGILKKSRDFKEQRYLRPHDTPSDCG